jgi:GntR family transcriptional repressor for pyruvate dehydrogenase complex
MGDKDVNLIKLWDADIKFHMAIVRASHNQVLVRVMQNMLDLMAESRRNTLKHIQRSLKSVDEHILICEAIIERDADLAAQRMIQHLENVYKDLFNH